MKRRFRSGVELDDHEFQAQAWARGMLQLHAGALYLCESGPHSLPAPYGILHRPTIKACFSDTISFSGIEAEGGKWLAQVWFCEVGSGRT